MFGVYILVNTISCSSFFFFFPYAPELKYSFSSNKRCCLSMATPHGLWDLTSRTRDQLMAPAGEAQRLNHWTTREASNAISLYGPPEKGA